MTDANLIFERFPDFIREYIYSHSWESLRGVQIAAAHTIFESDNNLLLTSSTASGKTEAAFFPILSELYENKPHSIGVLYIAPLKSLINDQFERLSELLDMTDVPLTHWHGDVAQSHKKKLLSNPKGILQITPESLESMLINRSNDIPRLFGDLRYVVIDEIHTLTGTDRGNQIICLLSRIARIIGYHPRRIGLSATIGDPALAAEWLSADTGRETDTPVFSEEKIRWRLGLEHFYIDNPELDENDTAPNRFDGSTSDRSDTKDTCKPDCEAEEKDVSVPEKSKAMLDAGYEYIYDCVRDKKSIVFSNSREETEYVCATLRQIAAKRGEDDSRILIHHGNLSASLREEAEMKMRDSEEFAVTCATVTMELGIDIGRLERVLQIQAPNTVSNFLQRLGRSGRRGQPPEMMMVFREEEALPNTPLPQLVPWELIRAIAIIQLYIEERFIEPPRRKKLPYSLLFHQTLSILAQSGELTPKRLAERVLNLPPFTSVPAQSYKELLASMLNNGFLELTEEKGLIIGLVGERLLKSFKFYAVFKDSEDFTVRQGSEEIGTITTPPPVGDRFALAGRVWEVEEIDLQRKLLYVHKVEGKMEISWPGDFGEIHTKILRRMKQVLSEDTVYPYLKENAQKRLDLARKTARNSGMLERSLINLGGYTYCLFPWLGTRSFRTLRKYIQKNTRDFGISGIEFEGCYYILFKMEKSSDVGLISSLCADVSRQGINCRELVSDGELPLFEKYDSYVSAALLRDAYAEDKLCADEAISALLEIYDEYKYSSLNQTKKSPAESFLGGVLLFTCAYSSSLRLISCAF